MCIISMAIDSHAIVSGTFEYHLLFGIDVPNKPPALPLS